VELLDTDILIDVQRRHLPAIEWFASLTDLPAIPGYVVMELIQDARNQREVSSALSMVLPFQVVWPAAADCTRALSDYAAHHQAHGLGLIDALVASTARGFNATLLTFNEKHYRPVADLKTRQPYRR
jgi:predicted nucleic acid-binding protein